MLEYITWRFDVGCILGGHGNVGRLDRPETPAKLGTFKFTIATGNIGVTPLQSQQGPELDISCRQNALPLSLTWKARSVKSGIICFFHFVRRFWNHVLTWVSLSFCCLAKLFRSVIVRYFLSWNLSSSALSWLLVKVVLRRRSLFIWEFCLLM